MSERIIKSPLIAADPVIIPEPKRVMAEEVSAGGNNKKKLDPSAEAWKKLREAEVKSRQMLEQARSEHQRLLDQARQQSEQLLQEARQQADSIREESRSEGFEQGKQEGRGEILQKMRGDAVEFENQVRELVESIWEEKERIIRQVEPGLTDLACAIAARIVRKEVAQDDTTVLRIIQQAIELATRRDRLTIKVNPLDLSMVRNNCEELISGHDGIRDIEFEEDPRIERGGCLIETPEGNVDGRLERQLDQIRHGLEQ